jgi:hypothetical protein
MYFMWSSKRQAFRRSGVQAFRTGKVKGKPVLVDPERLNA